MKISLAVSFIMLFTLVMTFLVHSDEYGSVDRTSIRCSLQNEVLNKVSKKHDLCPFGMGQMGPDKYTSLSLGFIALRPLNKDQARALIADIAAEFLETINSSESIRPYLSKYPFTIDNIAFNIVLHRENRESIKHPDFCSIGLFNGSFRFFTKDKEKCAGYVSKQSETFEEALEKLREQDLVPEYFKDYTPDQRCQ